ncbi:MAG: HAMP domain-containing protein [Planctomycetes bacterium]|nr:HAMP domain-containing protein [Planctomycetota bacterium]MCC7170525.1 HAMP domain-containing protein [Planctomycetota bacterium]
MTARLVALMAFVLFLCLGAFTLLLQSSREIVIREAKEALRTTSFETLDAVARASMEIRVADASTGMPWIGPWPPRTGRWWSALAHEAGVPTDLPGGIVNEFTAASGLAWSADATPLRMIDERQEVWITGPGAQVPGAGRQGNMFVRRGTEHRVAQFVPTGGESHPTGAELESNQSVRVLALTADGLVRTGRAGAEGSGSPQAPPEGMQLDELYVSNSDVTGVACEKFAITLAFLPGSVALAKSERASGPANEPSAVDLVLESDSKDSRKFVHFEVPGEFDSIFRAAQQKSLWWFVGVLAVGTVLSAGLARRFTRPIRDLDVALRRLSDGDLDVTVDVNGKHEVGRLQTAFNAMARRLAKSREIEKELHRREKLSALGRLAAGVAHDVRNPLHSIQLTLDHLGDAARPRDASPAHEFDRGVRLIRGEIERLDRLVENFLCFARADGRRAETVDLGALLADVANFVAKEAQRRGLVIAVEAETRGLELAANPESLRSALLNLVLNGFEAMSPGGTLTLRARTEGDAVVVEVEDTGRGIAPEDQERVFEFGFTTRADGHGLGLAMVHQVVVEEHGGRVGLASSPGVGTRVRIELPVRVPAQVVA